MTRLKWLSQRASKLPMSKKSESSHTPDEIRKKVRDKIARLELVVDEVRKGKIRKVRLSKTGKNTISYATLSEINAYLTKHGLELESEEDGKKQYRKRGELPDPTKPADAEVNRLRKLFAVRVLPDVQQRVIEASKAEGMTRQEWVERALIEALERDR